MLIEEVLAMESPLQKMLDRQVEVKTGDAVYRGRLVEITEEAVCLMARTGWREVSMDRIIAIKLSPEESSAGDSQDQRTDI